ncbi:hypothetical protein Barb6XT_01323 [Bacteroidales bacterium Barb6XT]|nr:hypothetical protein Barb6XT_01323 [Bacteroidales bacterium Barb6XT]
MKHHILLSALIVFSFLPVTAAQGEEDVYDKVFNVGVKIGFNAPLPVISSLSVNETEINNFRLLHKVGNLASVFCRVNIGRFFTQPSLSWQQAEGEINFDLPQTRLTMRIQSLQLPIMIGYNIVRQRPYTLSFMAGPTLRYNYKVNYTSLPSASRYEWLSESTPYDLNVCTGLSVRIRQLFFDFCYEFGLNQIRSDFHCKAPEISTVSENARINKRMNAMNFSIGILF